MSIEFQLDGFENTMGDAHSKEMFVRLSPDPGYSATIVIGPPKYAPERMIHVRPLELQMTLAALRMIKRRITRVAHVEIQTPVKATLEGIGEDRLQKSIYFSIDPKETFVFLGEHDSIKNRQSIVIPNYKLWPVLAALRETGRKSDLELL
jgi:hypothetical protein